MRRLLTALFLFSLTNSAPAATPFPKAPPGFRVELVLEAPEIEAPTPLAPAPPRSTNHDPSGIRLGVDDYLYVSSADKGSPRMLPASGAASAPRGSPRGADAAPLAGTIETAEGRRRRLPDGTGISLEGGG